MNKSLLVQLFGFPASLIHGDTLVLDRWLWLKRRLPRTRNGEWLLDVGCGTGAFTMGAARRGYHALGLTWDQRDAHVAAERARECGAKTAIFEVQDVRALDLCDDFVEAFDVVICCENIEHVMDDFKLMRDMAACVKPGGRLLLTTPNYYYRPITAEDQGPFSRVEDGWHVRRGYTTGRLLELCEHAGLQCERISYCSGVVSQKVTTLMRLGSRLHPLFGWAVALPLRWIPPLLDPLVTRALRYPWFSICLEAYKPVQPPQGLAAPMAGGSSIHRVAA